MTKFYHYTTSLKAINRSRDDAGIDLTCVDVEKTKNGLYMLKFGVSVHIAVTQFAILTNRSSTALRLSLIPANGIGIIDNGYTGELMFPVFSLLPDDTLEDVKKRCIGTRVVQLVVMPQNFDEVFNAPQSEDSRLTKRGSGRFGSTGK
jgi:dUTPase